MPRSRDFSRLDCIASKTKGCGSSLRNGASAGLVCAAEASGPSQQSFSRSLPSPDWAIDRCGGRDNNWSMSECLICDFADDSLGALLRRVDDSGVLITLACDFAERVVDLVPDPIHAGHWLRAARMWREYPAAREGAREAAQEATMAAGALKTTEAKSSKWSAAEAVWAAIETASSKGANVADHAVWTALKASEAADDPVVEREWQLAHTRELACTCPPIPEGDLACRRGRNSLLAS